MKKLLIVILIIMSVFGLCACQKIVEYDIEPTDFGGINFGKEAYTFLENLSDEGENGFADRTANKGGDKKMAIRIANTLQNFYKLTADKKYNDVLDENSNPFVGIDAFDYTVSSGSGKTYNIVYTKKAVGESKGKILLMAQYDNLYSHKLDDSNLYKTDGAYESGAATATLMTIAHYLSSADIALPYDIDFAFLGAGSYGWLGAKEYLMSFSAEERNKIALAVNFSSVAGGDNLYVYGRDKQTDYAEYFYQVAKTNNLGFTPVPKDKRVTQGQLLDDQKLTYFHAGMLGNHLYFANNLIPTLNFMSTNWEDTSLPSIVEKKGKENVYQTNKDTLAQMTERSGGKEKLEESMNKVVHTVLGALSAKNSKAFSMALSTARRQEINEIAQKSSTNVALTVAMKIIAIAFIFIMLGVVKKYVAKNQSRYAPSIEKNIKGDSSNQQVEEKPIDVFGLEDGESQSQIEGKNKTKEKNDDVFEGF